MHSFGVQGGDLQTGVVHFAGVNEMPALWLRRLNIDPTVIVFAENTPEIECRKALHDLQGDGMLRYVDDEGPQTIDTRDAWDKFVAVVDSAAEPYYPGSFDEDPLRRDTAVQVGDVFDFTPEEFRESFDGAGVTAEPTVPEVSVFSRADGRRTYDLSIELFGTDSAFADSSEESAALSPSERWAVPLDQLDQRHAALDCVVNSADKFAFSGLALSDGTGWLAGSNRNPTTLQFAGLEPDVQELHSRSHDAGRLRAAGYPTTGRSGEWMDVDTASQGYSHIEHRRRSGADNRHWER
ncbi:hypothetical protein ABZX12_41130 [Kribbella sp. NPDC003505]|uniref:hypothetical protein n=1 Tax=Kribbella sp. NPDC003505 TaxID=3154448 RepID=UPI0033A38780